MLIPWIDDIPDNYQSAYEAMAGTVRTCMAMPLSDTSGLREPMLSFIPSRHRLEAAMAYMYGLALTYPYRDEEEAPEWVFEVEEISILDYLDTDSAEAMARFARIYKAAGRDRSRAGLMLAKYFNFTVPHDAAVGQICTDYLRNRASEKALRMSCRGVWRLLGEEFHAHAALPQVVGGSAPEQVPVRADSAELAKLLRASGMTKVRIAELFNVTRSTLDGWLAK